MFTPNDVFLLLFFPFFFFLLEDNFYLNYASCMTLMLSLISDRRQTT